MQPSGRSARPSTVRYIRVRCLRALLVVLSAGLTPAPAVQTSSPAHAATRLPGRPNPDEIAYTIDRAGPNHIFISDLRGRHPSLLVKGRDPAWSPDGQWL